MFRLLFILSIFIFLPIFEHLSSHKFLLIAIKNHFFYSISCLIWKYLVSFENYWFCHHTKSTGFVRKYFYVGCPLYLDLIILLIAITRIIIQQLSIKILKILWYTRRIYMKYKLLRIPLKQPLYTVKTIMCYNKFTPIQEQHNKSYIDIISFKEQIFTVPWL